MALSPRPNTIASEAIEQPSGGQTRDARFAPATALYVHIPFCRHRCGYCNFSVIAGRPELRDAYVHALIHELRDIEVASVGPLHSIYWGGGTPTQLTDAQLHTLANAIRDHFSLAGDLEWSCEANPEDITPDKVRSLSDAGVNRVSLGVQSFNEQKLQRLERFHDASKAVSAIETCANQIPRVSVDLIFAAPDESISDWASDLDMAVSLPITHVSAYALTFEKGTSFWSRRHRGLLADQTEDSEIAMFQMARDRLGSGGLPQYEISNYAAKEHRCQHNLSYWAGAPWLAVGPGSARFVDGERSVNHRSPSTYLRRMQTRQSVVVEREPIDRDQYARELMAFGVRCLDGVSLDEISRKSGINASDAFSRSLDEMIHREWLVEDGNRIRLTEAGLLFADSVASRFLSY
ncbi:MAG: radical SAM family heme chaperone HemW [Planctomycetota bacterium]